MSMIAETLLLFAIASRRTTEITFARHGETIANATGHYNARTLNVLSAKGEEQAAAMVDRLSKLGHFDVILVSPSERVLKTFAPYLKATHQQATVWPLLYECCTGKREPRPSKGKLRYGAKIRIEANLSPLYRLESGHDRYPDAPDYGNGLLQVDESLREFRAKYLGKRVLLLGHSAQGGQFIHGLTGKWHKISNAQIIRFKVQQ